jgi:hypothetical protein
LLEIVAATPDDALDKVFSVFLHHKIETTGDWRRDAWIALLDRGIAAGFDETWFAAMSNAAPAILEYLGDIRFWLGEGEHADRLLNRLRDDFDAWMFVASLSTALPKEDVLSPVARRAHRRTQQKPATTVEGTRLAEVLRTRLTEAPPRLHGTWSEVLQTLKKLGAPQSQLQWFDKQRLKIIEEEMDARRVPGPEDDQSALVNWLGPL